MGFVTKEDLTAIFTNLNTKLKKKPTAVRLTQAQYDALTSEEKHDTSKTYYVTDMSPGGGGYVLPIASANELGGIKVGNNLSIDQNGVLSADGSTYELPKASSSILGGVKIGSNINVSSDGTISTHAQYQLPTASSSTLGGVKITSRTENSGLKIDNGALVLRKLKFCRGQFSLKSGTSTTISANTWTKYEWTAPLSEFASFVGGSISDLTDLQERFDNTFYHSVCPYDYEARDLIILFRDYTTFASYSEQINFNLYIHNPTNANISISKITVMGWVFGMGTIHG